VTAADPGRVLRLSLLAWGLGHLALGHRRTGIGLLVAEAVALLLVAWLTIALATTSAYIVPFLVGTTFIVAWAWQAVDAYRSAHARAPARGPTPERSPAAAIGWLSLPLLLWGTGFWLIGPQAATPSAVLDRFVTAWANDALGTDWPPSVRAAADEASRRLGRDADRFRNLRVEIVRLDGRRATAVADATHFERRASRFLGIIPGSQLVPVGDERVLTLELEAVPVELIGGGDIGAVRWELVNAE
jgi:hypothetical protein